MHPSHWDVPRTEEGLQTVLRLIDEARGRGDEQEVATGLLALSYLVPWTRSDTEDDPFSRAQDLSNQALEIFRRIGDRNGQVRALIAATRMETRQRTEALLDEAEMIAQQLYAEDESNLKLRADVKAARGRAMGLRDRNLTTELYKEALAIYRQIGLPQSQASVLFGLSIASEEPDALKCGYAVEASKLYEALGDLNEAHKCLDIALMNVEETALKEREALALHQLQLAQKAGEQEDIVRDCEALAEIKRAQGDPEAASRYEALADSHRLPSGRHPMEEWMANVEIATFLVDQLRRMEASPEDIATFQAQLDELLARMPDADPGGT